MRSLQLEASAQAGASSLLAAPTSLLLDLIGDPRLFNFTSWELRRSLVDVRSEADIGRLRRRFMPVTSDPERTLHAVN
jgi:hypothetical protein